MSKIVRIENHRISIVQDNGNIIEVGSDNLSFRPAVGDEVMLYQRDSKIIVFKASQTTSFSQKYYGELISLLGVFTFTINLFSYTLLYADLNFWAGGIITGLILPIPLFCGLTSIYFFKDLIKSLKKGSIKKLWYIIACILHALTALFFVGFTVFYFTLLTKQS